MAAGFLARLEKLERAVGDDRVRIIVCDDSRATEQAAQIAAWRADGVETVLRVVTGIVKAPEGGELA